MLKFNRITDSDLDIIKPYLSERNNRFCDYTVAGLYMWKDCFKMEYAIYEDVLYLSAVIDGIFAFIYPLGEKPNFQPIVDYCNKRNMNIVFSLVSEEGIAELEKNFEILFINHNRNWSDYLYKKDDLINLTGKKYATQRNHINKFLNNYPDHHIEEITLDNINRVIEFYLGFQNQQNKDGINYHVESEMTLELLKNFFMFDLLSLVLMVNDKVVGFSIGEIVNDTIYIDIEKADTNYEGVYPYISNNFLKKYAHEKVIYVNREEDDGDLGLRKSKESYRPIALLDKHVVEVIEKI